VRVRMELFARIRRDARVEGISIHGLAKRYQIGRDSVRQALSDPVRGDRPAIGDHTPDLQTPGQTGYGPTNIPDRPTTHHRAAMALALDSDSPWGRLDVARVKRVWWR
jgi:hypothetical protein